jgi:hypothetical protein
MNYQESIIDMLYMPDADITVEHQKFKQYVTQSGHKMLKMLMRFQSSQNNGG